MNLKVPVALCVVALAGCGPVKSSSGNQTEIVFANTADPVADAELANAELYDRLADETSAGAAVGSNAATPSQWTYSEQKDEMRGKIGRTATVDAVAPISLAWPYGDSTPTLHVRQDPKFGFDIFVTANGQFLCRTYNGDTVSVKFDDGPIKNWACAEADGGSPEIIFIQNEGAFLAGLRKAKKVTIEAHMYEAGRQQMTFVVDGLKW